MDLDLLFSVQDIESDFQETKTLFLEEQVINLNEGTHHLGIGNVISFLGQK